MQVKSGRFSGFLTRLLVGFAAFVVATLFFAVWIEFLPQSGLTWGAGGVISTFIIFGTWKWSERFVSGQAKKAGPQAAPVPNEPKSAPKPVGPLLDESEQVAPESRLMFQTVLPEKEGAGPAMPKADSAPPLGAPDIVLERSDMLGEAKSIGVQSAKKELFLAFVIVSAVLGAVIWLTLNSGATPSLDQGGNAVLREASWQDPHSEITQALEQWAKVGDRDAQYQVGRRYMDGHGAVQDYSLAICWLRLAATREDARAMNSYGIAFETGKGVERSLVHAHLWYNLAAARGDEAAANNRSRLNSKLSRTDLAEAQRLAREWTPTPLHNRYLQWYRSFKTIDDVGNPPVPDEDLEQVFSCD